MNKQFLISTLYIIAAISGIGLMAGGLFMAFKSMSDWGWPIIAGMIVIWKMLGSISEEYDKDDMRKAWQQGRDGKEFNPDEEKD